MILVDSSVWIGYFNGIINPQTDWLDQALGKKIIILQSTWDYMQLDFSAA